METLRSRRESPGLAFVLGFFLLLVYAVPAVAFLTRALREFSLSDLSFDFLSLVFKSLLFTLAQASLTTVLVLALATLLGSALFFLASKRLSKIFEGVGLLFFALPGVAMALLILKLGRLVHVSPRGLGAVVAAHFLFNFVFVATQIEKTLRSHAAGGLWMNAEAAASLGARPLQATRLAFGPSLLSEFRTWGPLVFLWSFSAFATVLILGNGAGSSSPEILLYQSLQNDPSLSRVFVLAWVQVGLGYLVARNLYRARREPWVKLPRGGEAPNLSETLRRQKIFPSWLPPALAGLLGFFALLPALTLLWPEGNFANFEGLRPLAYSAALAALVASGAAFYTRIILRLPQKLRQRLPLLFSISPTLLAATWMGLGLDLWLEHRALAQFFLCALALLTVQTPLIAWWVENRLETLDEGALEAALSLGATPRQAERLVVWPHLREVQTKIMLSAALLALGELSFTSLMAGDVEFLAVYARRAASHYDFSANSTTLLVLFIFTALLLGVLGIWGKFWRQRLLQMAARA